MLKAADIHAQLGSSWPAILARLGIDETFLRPNKSGPCPACSGRDRYMFYGRDRQGRYNGTFYCRGCGGYGDGFELLRRVHGWPFSEARRHVLEVAGLDETAPPFPTQIHTRVPTSAPISSAPPRVMSILRSTCPVSECTDALDYLASRNLWPLLARCSLRAHPGLDYWEEAQRVARYPGLVAELRDIDGELVTVHVTYLLAGAKIVDREPRKILSKLEGRAGCAVRLMPVTDTLVIAEGIETALSAAVLLDLPAWAALNTSLLARFEPPPGVTRLVIAADRDVPGLTAAGSLMERLQGRIRVELRLPTAPANDFNDQLTRAAGAGAIHV